MLNLHTSLRQSDNVYIRKKLKNLLIQSEPNSVDLFILIWEVLSDLHSQGQIIRSFRKQAVLLLEDLIG